MRSSYAPVAHADVRNAMLFRHLFPSDVLVAEMDPRDVDPSALLPEEAVHVQRAVEKRVREFAAGRVLARRLLGELGIAPAFPLVPGPRREPLWPPGIVGTITHTEGCAAVAVAHAAAFSGLGADVEQDTPLAPKLWSHILTPEDDPEGLDPDDADGRAKLIFSAKECAYKAQYAQSRSFLGFAAMAITLVPGDRFVARFRVDAPPFRIGDTLHGRYARRPGPGAGTGPGLVATAIALPPRDSTAFTPPRG